MKKFLVTLVAALVLVTGTSLSAQLTYTQFAVAAGSVILDGSNPTTVATGLREIRACTANIIGADWAVVLGSEPTLLTVVPHADRGELRIYAWDNADPPAASTSVGYFVSYICIGIT